LGGCRVLPRRGIVVVCREPAAVAAPVAALPGRSVGWDGRFRLSLPLGAPPGLRLGALGPVPLVAESRLPAAVRAGLPALSDDKSVAAVPSLGYVRVGFDARWLTPESLIFRPTRPLSGAGFTVV
jgi:tRNA(Ile)-lysidine synthase